MRAQGWEQKKLSTRTAGFPLRIERELELGDHRPCEHVVISSSFILRDQVSVQKFPSGEPGAKREILHTLKVPRQEQMSIMRKNQISSSRKPQEEGVYDHTVSRGLW